jgi:hypothetical protein
MPVRLVGWWCLACFLSIPAVCRGGFTVDIVINGDGVGDVIATDGAGILVNTSATTQLSVNSGTVLKAKGTSRGMKVEVTPQDVVLGQALTFTNYQVSTRSVLTSYSRISSGGATLPGLGEDIFQVNSNTKLIYQFDRAVDSAIRQYQYFLGIGPNPTQVFLNDGLVFSSTPLNSIAWDVFKDLEIGGKKFAEIGNNKYGVLRALDWGGGFDDFVFQFDILPSGGSAVPEPSAVLLVSATAFAGWFLRRKRQARKEAGPESV